MAYYLPPGPSMDDNISPVPEPQASGTGESMADLKVFWGPEICRLEYLMHLVETGRIKDEHAAQSA